MFTTARLSYLDALARNTMGGVGSDKKITEKILMPDEYVHAALVGSASSDDLPVMLLTDRRFLHLPVGVFRRWWVDTEAPLHDILGADVRERGITRFVDVHLTAHRRASMSVHRGQNHDQFLQAVDELRRHGGAWPAHPERSREPAPAGAPPDDGSTGSAPRIASWHSLLGPGELPLAEVAGTLADGTIGGIAVTDRRALLLRAPADGHPPADGHLAEFGRLEAAQEAPAREVQAVESADGLSRTTVTVRFAGGDSWALAVPQVPLDQAQQARDFVATLRDLLQR